MHELFNKPLAELSLDDIDALVTRSEPESQYLELKEESPGKGDDWKKAAPELAAEVVAFANADGGVLVMGIKDENNQATEVVPIANVDGVADSLSRSFTSLIDPYPVGLEVASVSYSDDSGVIVTRIPASLEAPHGVKYDKQRFRVMIRRGEESKPLDMRDIQLHTLETRRRADDAEERLEARRASFQRTDFLEAGSPTYGGYRVTVTPARAVYRVPELKEHAVSRLLQNRDWLVTTDQGRPLPVSSCAPTAISHGWRPCLRGLTAQNNLEACGLVTFTAFEEGTVDLSVLPPEEGPHLKGWQVLADVIALVDVATNMRSAAGAGRAELMVDVEFAHIGPDPSSDPHGTEMSVETESDSQAIRTPLRFPRYTLVEPENLSQVAAVFWQDVCDVAGVMERPNITHVEWR